jgi:hypothetical protein
MNRQPPVFLERLVGRLLPRAAREHVLGDLSERYTSPVGYVLDAARTVPFVVTSELQRSGHSAAPVIQTVALRVSMLLALVGVVYVAVQLVRGVVTPRWFSPLSLLISYSYVAFWNSPRLEEFHASVHPSSLLIQRQALVTRIERVRDGLRFSAAPAVLLCAMPFLQIAVARMSGGSTPAFDGRLAGYSVALAILAMWFAVMLRANNRRALRNLQQQLDALS